ncbi:MAG: acetate--CoA ligase family protein [Desulfobacterales bacterium]|jgi:acyl-CoA synthetase (NDP forming)
MSYKKDLSPLLSPKSIAVIGASEKFGAGSLVIENLRNLGFDGAIFPVNPGYAEVLGLPCYPSLADIPSGSVIDCVAVVLGSGQLLPMMEQAAQRGIRGAWAFASGFAETGSSGAALQSELKAFCEANGILFCGPNCVGYVNLHDSVGTFSAPISPTLRGGNIGVVAQSGSVVLALANSNRGIGFSTIISSGNEAVLDTVDYLEHFLDDPRTQVITAFIEGIGRIEALKECCIRAAEMGKPIIVVKVGRSELARRTVVSHTGALAGTDAVYEAIFKKYGVIRVDDLDQLLETAALFSGCKDRLPRGNRIGMVTVSGGEIGLIGDTSKSFSFEYPSLSTKAEKELKRRLPAYTNIANPLDAWGSGDLKNSYPACLEILAAEDTIDLIAISQDSPPGMSERQVTQYSDVARAAVKCARGDKPVVVFSHVSGGLDPTLTDILDRGGVPFLQGTRESLSAIDRLVSYAEFQRCRKSPDVGMGVSPADLDALKQAFLNKSGILSYQDSQMLIGAYGIPVPDGTIVNTEDEAVAAAVQVGYPVVIKAQAPQFPHKTEVGLVRINIPDEAALRKVYRTLVRRVEELDPTAQLEGVLVQEMIPPDSVEAMVGILADSAFDPIVVCGLGGIFVELLQDSALGLSPIGRQEACRMIVGLKGYRLLDGFRGRPKTDVDALIKTIVQVGQLAQDFSGCISSLDINPLMVMPTGLGVVAADILIEMTPAVNTVAQQ